MTYQWYCVLILINLSLHISNASENGNKLPPNLLTNEVFENNTEPENEVYKKNCGEKMCVPKCCRLGEFVGKRRTCVKVYGSKILDFSDVPIYDKKLYKTGNSLKDVFTPRPWKYVNRTVQEDAFDYKIMNHNYYLSEDGMLHEEVPNKYWRWHLLNSSRFCVDYLGPNKKIKVPEPRFWTILDSNNETAVDHPLITGGLLVSCVFLILVLIVYSLLPELRNLVGRVLMAYVFSLLMAFMLLAIIQLGPHKRNTCIGLTCCIYFFFLASFCWMNVMSCDIWWTFRGYAKARPIHRRGEHFKFAMYCLYAFGVPLAMTSALVVLNTVDMRHLPWFVTPNIPNRGCFIGDEPKLLYLSIPMLIMILCNWAFFLMTAFNVWHLHRSTTMLNSEAAGTLAAHPSQQHRLMVYVKLSIIMGINWVLEVISSFKPHLKLWYATVAFNLLFGLFIFLILVCKKKILRKLVKRYRGYDWRRRHKYSKSRTGNTTSDSDVSTEVPLQVCANPKGPAVKC